MTPQKNANLSVQTPELYVVHVSKLPPGQLEPFAENFAMTFGVSQQKALGLLGRLPGNATKAIPLSEAKLIRSFFQNAGAKVSLKPFSEAIKDNASVRPISSDIPEAMTAAKATAQNTDPPSLSMEDFQKHLEQHSPSDTSASVSQQVIVPLERPRRSLLTQLWAHTLLTVSLALLLSLSAGLYLALTASIQQQAAQLQATASSLAQGFSVLSNLLGQERSAVQTIASAQAVASPHLLFAYAVDATGTLLAGWQADKSLDTAALEAALRNQTFLVDQPVSSGLMQQALSRLRFPPDAVSVLSVNNQLLMGQELWFVSHPLISNSEPIGTLVLGLDRARFWETTNPDFVLPLILSLTAFCIAALFAYALSRRIQRRLRQLNEQAHAVSLGQLDREVHLQGQDELQQLAASLERLRISTREALKRLQQR